MLSNRYLFIDLTFSDDGLSEAFVSCLTVNFFYLGGENPMKIVYQHETWLSLNMTNNKMEFGPDGDAVRMSILNDREKGFQSIQVDPFGLSINRFVLIRYGAITVFLSNNLVVSYVWSYHQRDSRLHLRFNRLHSNFYFYC